MGRMGICVRETLSEHDALAVGAAIDAPDHPAQGTTQSGVSLAADCVAAAERCSVAISFSLPAPTLELLRACEDAQIPAVIGTTGFSAEHRVEIDRIAARIPLVLAANFSVAVNVLFRLVREASTLVGSGYDAEVIELHHNQKVDAPSGTALALGRAVAEGRGDDFEKVALRDRDGITGPRPEGAIGLQALRGGDVAGEHTVLLIGGGERLELSHRASTREHFARGAVRAAEWVLGRPAGTYDMQDVLGLR